MVGHRSDGRAAYDYSERVVLVTGASRGIGVRIAEAFADAGARVVVNGRDAEALDATVTRLRALGVEALGVPADLRSYDGARQLVEAAVRTFGTVDVLVNNAGGNFALPLAELSPNGWRAQIETNLTSVFHCAHACYPVFAAQGSGSVVNIGSVGGESAHPGRAAYGAAKAGVAALTKSMAWEWAPDGIRVNCVAPGAVRTPASRFAEPTEERRAAEHVPLRRLGEPDDVAAACLFLCSDGAAYITGVTLRVDGGPTTALAADGVRPVAAEVVR
jgi:3-oxoacyl-[acyl-carrier protein] reductase